MDLEIPTGKRTRKYRFFERVPALVSYGAIIVLVVLSIIHPVFAAVYLLIIILTMLIKAFGIAYQMIVGRSRMDKASNVDWQSRLNDLEDPKEAYARHFGHTSRSFGFEQHRENLRLMAAAEEGYFPRPSELYNALIVPAYNEPYEIIENSIKAVLDTTYDKSHLIVVFTYEERGGAGIKRTAAKLQKKFAGSFHTFQTVEHPRDIPNEVIGKGGNITHAGRWLKGYLEEQDIAFSNVIVTTMDCDNKPHKTYFDYLMYEYIVHEDRKHLSYQPVCLFTSNIWDVPAPMRVVATGNSFWNIISSMRPHTLRNFASHAQPMDALAEMDFWSVRTIVEDGHQYWRSYFYFGGNYSVVPLHVPIYQDAVLSDIYLKTLKAQFIQLRRWAYGASDVPYVAVRIFTKQRNVPFWSGFTRFVRLLDGHVTLACVSILVTFGGWVPLLINGDASRVMAVHQLPDTISLLQRIAMIGLVISIFTSFKLLPPRPARYKRRRNVLMVLQWVLMPVTAIVYSSAAAFYSQTRLFFGDYLDRFDVTEKTTVDLNDRAKHTRSKAGRRDDAS
jgi:cellulose synthase/poly-beta-1,6-N-acetylglucosamine synthase-like glycosyltransferase